jgi:hypothetical protein
MDPGECLPGSRSPMSQETFFNMIEFERFLQERIIFKENHARAEIKSCAPVRVDPPKFFCA